MRVLETIAREAKLAGLPFLIIGGYAVMAHGFIRSTDDLDLLVHASRIQEWRRLLEQLGFTLYREARSFLQFNPPADARLPVDLMMVTDEVFEQMHTASKQSDVADGKFEVVSLLHLIALKCHAIQNGPSLRKVKDTEDLIQLIGINGLDLKEMELRTTILKHGNQELYEKLQRATVTE